MSSSAWDYALFGLCNGILNHLVDSLQLTQNALQEIQIKTFLKLTVHFFECLYDPYFVWRKRLKGLVQTNCSEKSSEHWSGYELSVLSQNLKDYFVFYIKTNIDCDWRVKEYTVFFKNFGLLHKVKTFWSFYRWVVDKSRMTYKPAELHVEVVPFFYGRHSQNYYHGRTLSLSWFIFWLFCLKLMPIVL